MEKLFRRKEMGERKGIFYARLPFISKIFISILVPIDSLLARASQYSKYCDGGKATLIALLTKAKT
jgi:hypothetical protein